MNKEQFWNLICVVKNKSNNSLELTENFKSELSKLSSNDLMHFILIYEIYETAVISQPSNIIWSAQFLINRGIYTNTYHFTGWLIVQGRVTYLESLLDADYLAEIKTPERGCEYSSLIGIATNLYKSKTKKNKRDCKKAEIEFWEKPEIQKEEREIMAEIIFNKTKRQRNWKIPDLENILPNLYRKITAHNNV